MHGNVIPSNVVYTNNNHFLLVDTGHYLLNDERQFNISFHSQFYNPEYLCNKEQSIESDIWGFGLILAFIVSGEYPINILNGCEWKIYINLTDNEKDVVYDLVTKCLNYDQYKRITPYELILYNESIYISLNYFLYYFLYRT